ncbi:hypothetical protein V8E54_007259 [Elaphomyces granulatus]
MTASIFKSALEKATAAQENLTPGLLKTKPGDYAMKAYHQFRKEKEVGAVPIAAFLIGHPAFYMPNEKSKNLDLFWVKRNVQKYANLSRVDSLDSTDDEAEAFSTFKPTGEASSSYLYGLHLPRPKTCAFLLIRVLVSNWNMYSSERSPSRPGSDGDGEIDGLWVPAIYGRLTGVNNRGDSADRILRDSQDVQHYIAEALLGLFVPWERLTPLFAKTLPMSPFSRNPEMLALQSGTISSPPFRRTYNDWP